MSRTPVNPSQLPYVPRQRGAKRPERDLPPVPADQEMFNTSNLVEADQHYTSPPSPPKPAPAPLPPPPPRTSSRKSSGAKASPSHLHPHVSSLPTAGFTPPTTLTPLRAHYLKKTLVNLQMQHEIGLLTDPVLGANSLGLLGEPFQLPEKAKREAIERVSEVARQEGRLGDLPFMRFLFHQFVLPFPFLTSAPPTFWSHKVQPFLSSFLQNTGYTRTTRLTEEEERMAESLMTKEEKKEVEERNKLWSKIEKHLSLMVAVGVKVVGGEEVVRIGQSELRRLEQIQEDKRRRVAERRARKAERDAPPPPPGQEGQAPPPPAIFDVNVVGIRLITEKGRVRNKHREEFLIRTRRAGTGDVFVSRRYGDFKRLGDELRHAFPDTLIAPPPPKDRTAVATNPAPAATGYGYYNPLRAFYGSGTPTESGPGTPNEPGSPTSAAPTTPLSRERNRLTLRAYLQNILQYDYYANSPVVRSFLLSNPTGLTPEEAVDCQRRLEADAVREEGRRRFREEAERRVESLRQGLAQFKGDVLSSDGGLQRVFEVVRRVEKVGDLPPAEASVLEWGRISFAATIFQIFVASDTASDTLANLKRIHGLMPYFVLKGILKISNPMAMIRGVLDLFLARPFGGQSLVQKMFSASLTEDVRLITEDIEIVAEKIDDPVLCQKVEQYAMAPFEIQEIYRKDAVSEGLDLLVVILRSPDMPTLSRPQFQRVYRASRAYKEYKLSQEDLSDSDDDLGPENDDAWLFEDLNILLKLWMRKREKEQLLALIFEGVTAELLKDIITIFYAPLATVYKAASIADSLGDLQNFLNDMIKTVEQVEELSQEDPQRTVQTFIDLVQRHEQAFYTFVHNVHAKGHGLFDSLMAWIELFLMYARTGISAPVDLEFILPHGGETRQNIMAEVDAVAQYHYKLKIAHEEKVRRRFYKNAGTEVSADEAAILEGVMQSLSIGESTLEDAQELEDEESTDEEEEEGYSEDEEDEELERLDEEEERRLSNETESSLRRASSARQSAASLATPDHLGPDLPPLSADGGKSTSKKKDRSSLESKRKGGEKAEKEREERAKRASELRRGGGKRLSKKARARLAKEALEPPETPAIAELRPLFVEAIRPLLKIRPLAMLPPDVPSKV